MFGLEKCAAHDGWFFRTKTSYTIIIQNTLGEEKTIHLCKKCGDIMARTYEDGKKYLNDNDLKDTF